MAGGHGHLRVVHAASRVAAGAIGVGRAGPTGCFATLTPTAPAAWGGAMNDPEVTMLEPPADQLIALTTAIEAAGLALSLARRVPAPLTSLADQVVRSASLGRGQPLGRARSVRSRSTPPLADRLCLGQRGRHPPPAAGRGGSGRRRARPGGPSPLRPGARHDLAAAASESVSGPLPDSGRDDAAPVPAAAADAAPDAVAVPDAVDVRSWRASPPGHEHRVTAAVVHHRRPGEEAGAGGVGRHHGVAARDL